MSLNCCKVNCDGEYQTSPKPDVLIECEKCSDSLAREPTKELARKEGPVGQLANAILERSGYEREDEVDRREVYLAEAEPGEVKIGVSKNAQERLKQLSTGSSEELELLYFALVNNAQAVEQHLHEKWSEYRKRGEWFEMPVEKKGQLIQDLKEVAE